MNINNRHRRDIRFARRRRRVAQQQRVLRDGSFFGARGLPAPKQITFGVLYQHEIVAAQARADRKHGHAARAAEH